MCTQTRSVSSVFCTTHFRGKSTESKNSHLAATTRWTLSKPQKMGKNDASRLALNPDPQLSCHPPSRTVALEHWKPLCSWNICLCRLLTLYDDAPQNHIYPFGFRMSGLDILIRLSFRPTSSPSRPPSLLRQRITWITPQKRHSQAIHG